MEEKNNLILDVRERDEFQAQHVEGSINIPLSEFEKQGMCFVSQLEDKTYWVMCRSGKRASLALEMIQKKYPNTKAKVYSGGILKWAEFEPTVKNAKSSTPIFRQVFTAAGFFVFLGSLLALTFSLNFVYFTLAVGFGLLSAGLTGFCPMANILMKMPWNKSTSTNCSVERSCSISQ